MIPRSYSIFALVLLGSLVGVVMLNLYVVKPNLSTTPSAPAPVIGPLPVDSVGSSAIVEKIIIKSTEQTIMEIDSQVAADRSDRPVREHANPFLWPEELTAAIERERIAVAAQQNELLQGKVQRREELEIRQPTLNMVIIGEKRKLALLDDTFVYEGDLFRENMLVQQISEDEIVLLTDMEEEIRIPLADIRDIRPAALEQAVAELEESGAPSGLVQLPAMPDATDSQQQSIQQQVDMVNTLFEQLKPFLQEGK